ncbi:conserved protein of unknown function [Methylocaldum szegediense]|uniref:DUF3800 domain-containing protein n=2 Tax=Methylocaldum szegediense TaxID=73780 RepID=A0ABN8WZZ9_9GAMM|nr:conserved protein of unknown function [Methylocaldum szegediense]
MLDVGKRAMYAYVDETGNTGPNIFDPEQPVFMTAALITKTNFDLVHKKEVARIARIVGETELHANVIGIDRIEQVAGELLALFKRSDARFFVSRIEKRYLAATKFVDTLFDSFENKAVPWHVYNMRPMRLLLVFKVASILTEDTAKKFWESILEKREQRAYEIFIESLQELRENVIDLPDQRSRQLITEAIDWATQNPEAIYIHTNSKAARLGHLPNLAVFPNLLDGIEQRSKLWKRKVVEIVHDRQSQFQGTLRDWHELYKNAAPDVITWTMGEKYTLRRVEGSEFRVSSAHESAGIQAIDAVLWLFKRVIEEKPLGYRSARLMNHVFKRAYQNDLSFDAVGRWLEGFFADLYSRPFTEEHQKRAEEYGRLAEQRRQEEMLHYAQEKLSESI